jgi:hypothetical protein
VEPDAFVPPVDAPVVTERFVTANWTLRSIASGTTQACPIGSDTAAVYSQPVDDAGNSIGSVIIDLFDCSGGTGTTAPLPAAHYTEWIEITDHNNTSPYAQSTSAAVDLTTQDQTFSAEILTDGGYFSFAWNLTRTSNGAPLTCAEVSGLAGIEAISTDVSDATNSASDIFPCTDGTGITSGLLAATYTVHVDALDTSNLSIGDAADLTNKVIMAPNKVTNLGTITVPITAL